MATVTPQDDYMKTALRLPRELHGRLMEHAQNGGRSFNSELVWRLQESLDAPAAPVAYELEQERELVTALRDAVEAHKERANLLLGMSRTLAGIIKRAVAMLTPSQKAAAPEMKVFEAVADSVANGDPLLLAMELEALAGKRERPLAVVPAHVDLVDGRFLVTGTSEQIAAMVKDVPESDFVRVPGGISMSQEIGRQVLSGVALGAKVRAKKRA